jgi:predicted nuclease of predicted toxin-antitoxin system
VNRFYADEDFPHSIVRALRRRNSTVDVLTIQNDGLQGAPDSEVLARAAELGRVLVTRDKNTLVASAYERIEKGEGCPGIVVLLVSCSTGDAVEHLELLALAESPENLRDQVRYLPLT